MMLTSATMQMAQLLMYATFFKGSYREAREKFSVGNKVV